MHCLIMTGAKPLPLELYNNRTIMTMSRSLGKRAAAGGTPGRIEGTPGEGTVKGGC